VTAEPLHVDVLQQNGAPVRRREPALAANKLERLDTVRHADDLAGESGAVECAPDRLCVRVRDRIASRSGRHCGHGSTA